MLPTILLIGSDLRVTEAVQPRSSEETVMATPMSTRVMPKLRTIGQTVGLGISTPGGPAGPEPVSVSVVMKVFP